MNAIERKKKQEAERKKKNEEILSQLKNNKSPASPPGAKCSGSGFQNVKKDKATIERLFGKQRPKARNEQFDQTIDKEVANYKFLSYPIDRYDIEYLCKMKSFNEEEKELLFLKIKEAGLKIF